MSMQLFGSLTSPYVRKVRVALAEKALDYAYVNDDVWSADAQVGRYNPLGKVPCLVLDDGRGLYDSRVIVDYLDTLAPVPQLVPPGHRLEVGLWQALADGVLDAAVSARLEQTWPGRSDDERSPAWIARQMQKIEAALAAMAEGLGTGPWCVSGAGFTLADIAVGAALNYLDLRFPDLGWRQAHPTLAHLYDRQIAPRASFARITAA